MGAVTALVLHPAGRHGVTDPEPVSPQGGGGEAVLGHLHLQHRHLYLRPVEGGHLVTVRSQSRPRPSGRHLPLAAGVAGGSPGGAQREVGERLRLQLWGAAVESRAEGGQTDRLCGGGPPASPGWGWSRYTRMGRQGRLGTGQTLAGKTLVPAVRWGRDLCVEPWLEGESPSSGTSAPLREISASLATSPSAALLGRLQTAGTLVLGQQNTTKACLPGRARAHKHLNVKPQLRQKWIIRYPVDRDGNFKYSAV